MTDGMEWMFDDERAKRIDRKRLTDKWDLLIPIRST